MINISGDIILTGGALVPWRGFMMFIEIMPLLKKINPNFKLIIFGSGPQMPILKQAIKQADWQHDILMPGRLSTVDIYKYYSAAWLFVLNSCYEPFIQNILHAMHYHVPVIASNRGGNPELIQDDYNGCLVEQNNKHDWLQAIQRLWNNQPLRRRLSANPLVKLEVFSFQHMAKEIVKILFT